MLRSLRFTIALAFVAASASSPAARAETIDFSGITVPVDTSLPSSASGDGEMDSAAFGYTVGGTTVYPPYSTYGDGEGGTNYSSSFSDGGAQFANTFDQNQYYTSYAGWAVSNVDGVIWPSPSNYSDNDYVSQYQFTSYNGDSVGQTEGGGYNGAANYAVVYDDGNPADSMMTLPAGTSPVSMEIDATTYMALNAVYGDGFDTSGFQHGDTLTLNILGYYANGSPVGDVSQVMEDYPVGTNSPWVMDQWTYISLTSLAGAAYLEFSVSGGPSYWAVGYPTFFAADNLVLTPEPSSLVLLLIAGVCTAAVAARRRMRCKCD